MNTAFARYIEAAQWTQNIFSTIDPVALVFNNFICDIQNHPITVFQQGRNAMGPGRGSVINI